MKLIYSKPEIEIEKITAHDILLQSDVLIPGGSLFDTDEDADG